MRHCRKHALGVWRRGNLLALGANWRKGPGGGFGYGGKPERRVGLDQKWQQLPPAVRREDSRDHGHRSRQRVAQLDTRHMRDLRIDDRLFRLYSRGIQLLGHRLGNLASPRMQQRFPAMMLRDHTQKLGRPARTPHHLEAGRARHLRGAPPHAIGAPTCRGTRRDNRRDRMFGGEDQCLCLRDFSIKRLDLQQGRDDHRPVAPEPRPELLRETFRRSARARQQQNRTRSVGMGHGLPGLCELFPGVTCEGKTVQPRPMTASLTFLGIESSCDDTAAAIVRLHDGRAEVLSSVVAGQTNLHAAFGGVVPEIAARAHAERLDLCVEEAMQKAGLGFDALDGIAATAGPGLIGGVMSGVMCAKGLAAARDLPLVGVNHLAGHALTPRLTDGLEFPYLMLLVSGGHCQFLVVEGQAQFTRLGGTIDDAPGEAFDKTAKLLGLPQPGGPAVEAEAAAGDPRAFAFPRPLLDRPGCDLSFSGLKTALLRARDAEIAAHGGLRRQARRDLCASFQQAVADVLVEKTRRALHIYLAQNPAQPTFAVAGGVAANRAIRAALETVCTGHEVRFTAPPLALCTDNAAMIAYAGIERFMHGARDDMTLTARPRWPLDESAPTLLGSGKKGAKA